MSSIRLPLAVGFSVAVGLSIHVLQTRFNIPQSRGAWVGLQCAVIMDMSVPERILVRAVLRAFGSVVGAMLGVILALLYEQLGEDQAVPTTSQRLFQLFAMIVVSLICSISVKMFKDFTYAFVLILNTVAIAVYPPNLDVAVEWMASVCVGVAIAGFSLAVFHYPSAAQTVLDCYAEVMTSCVDFVALSICGSACHLDKSQHHEQVHTLTHKLSVSHEALQNYIRVHKYIKSHKATVSHLNALSEALRAVYHRAHSVYLTLTHASNADLFADEQFCQIFGYHVLRLKDTFLAIKEKLSGIHQRKHAFNSDQFILLIADLENLNTILFTLKTLYLKHQDGFLAAKNIRWSVLCVLITVAPVVSALTDYALALARFMTPYSPPSFPGLVDSRLIKVKHHIDLFLDDHVIASHKS